MKIKFLLNKKNYRFIIIALAMLLSCFSCTKEERKEAVSSEIFQTTESIVEPEKYRYIINIGEKSGKVHTYHHGMEIIENPNHIFKTNESLEEILKNEKYDICLTCKAGVKLNLDRYEKTNDKVKNKLIDDEINLINKFMNMYEFGKLDTETQKFLVCLFEVGEWYVDNVYTYQGGNETVSSVNKISNELASQSANQRWNDYKKEYEQVVKRKINNDEKVLPIVYDSNDRPTPMVIYRCELFRNALYGKGSDDDTKKWQRTLKTKDRVEVATEWKNYCVLDDCSKFATAVYYHYINKEILNNVVSDKRTAYDIDLWGTGSELFSYKRSKIINKLVMDSKKFKFIDLTSMDNYNNILAANKNVNNIDLRPGDMIYRKINYKDGIDGHVEFYIGNNRVMSWGRVHKSYYLNKIFKKQGRFFYSNDVNDKEQPYVAIIRFKGDKYEQKN